MYPAQTTMTVRLSIDPCELDGIPRAIYRLSHVSEERVKELRHRDELASLGFSGDRFQLGF
jgi:hypothetical protein